MNSAVTYTTSVRIAASHPALPGHFPGRPVVPGVVLLDRVLAEAEHWLRRPVHPSSLPNAKFTAPLLPEQDAELQLKFDGDELRFHLSRDGAPIAQGLFRIGSRVESGRGPFDMSSRVESGRGPFEPGGERSA